MTTPQDALMPEPFGYFRAEPFGWTDCAPDDDGAIPLYERTQSARIAELEAEVERLRVDAERYEWLRDCLESDWAICEWSYLDHRYYRDARESSIVDSAIDAARAKQAGGGVGG